MLWACRSLALSVFLLVWAARDGIAKSDDLGAWLATNNPRVIQFLKGLGPQSVGSRVRPVRLSDGSKVFSAHTYVGQVPELARGAHVYLFSRHGGIVAYIWVDPKSRVLPLPKCAHRGPNDDEPATVLSGDVYTWRAVQPGDGVVIFTCPSEEWLRRAGG